MDLNFLMPLNTEMLDFASELAAQNLGKTILCHTPGFFPDLSSVNLAIIGVLENRGGCKTTAQVNLDAIRKELYLLYPGNWNSFIADLGDLKAGDSLEDTYFALKKIVALLLKQNIIPIIIGGTQDLTYPLYRAYDELEQMVNIAVIDSKFDFGKEGNSLSSESYLSQIILNEPNNLFNFCNIGYQTYFNSQEEIDLIEKLFFDAYRLGQITHDITLAEPIFRDTDLVSIDLNAIQSSVSGNTTVFTPNGLNGKEICALSRYAGISDKVSCLGLFNHTNTHQEAVLIAQIIWYFMEGHHFRSKEYPFGSKKKYLKYIVPLENQELNFYKSNKTERWWIEMPFVGNGNNKLKKTTLLPCSYEEYLAACNQELPERWWKAYRKSLV